MKRVPLEQKQSGPARSALALLTWALLAATAVHPSAAAGPLDKENPALRLVPFEYHPQDDIGPTGSTAAQFSLPATGGMDLSNDAAAPDSLSRAVAPWTGLGSNALRMFGGSKAILHLTAVAATVLIVETGLDTQVHNFFVRNPAIDRLSRPGVGIGSDFPIYLGVGLLGTGLIGSSSRIVSAGGAVLQASLLALCYTTALKALTGRPGPSPVIYNDNQASQTFRFGILRGGVFHGWPSGHVLANTAAVTSLLAFYHNSTWLKVAGGAYLGYLFLSVISRHGSAMHWFSDTVAGILMGYAIGTTVGSDFRERWEGKQPKATGLEFSLDPRALAISFEIPF